jgi:transposase
MTVAVLGIDIAKGSFQVSLCQAGKKYNRTFRNEAKGFATLDKWLTKHEAEQLHACMEATGRYWEELAWHLHQGEHTVSVVNPARIHNYAKSKLTRNKTDKLDAQLIADYCATQHPDTWTPPPPEVRELQALVRHLEDVQQIHNQESNRLGSGVPAATVREMLQKHVAFLDAQLQDLQQQIEAHIDRHPGLKQQSELLASIPGIGTLTAAKLLGENIQSFSSTRALAAYAGLNPQHGDSGSSVRRKPRLSKVGNSALRKALYFPAISAKSHNPIIKAFCERLKERGKQTMVIIGAAMRKLLCLALGVLKSGQPFDPNYVHRTGGTI